MTITFDDFKKLEIRIGKVIFAEKVEGADKLLKLEVDFGPAEQNSEKNLSAEVSNENFQESALRSSFQLTNSSDAIVPASLDKLGTRDTVSKADSSEELVHEKPPHAVNIRQIVSGIAQFYTPENIIGKQFPFIINLEPRKIRGVESQGMIMVTEDNGKIVLLNPDKEVENGSKLK